MKRIIFTLIYISILVFSVHSQIVEIPDKNFKSALINLGIDKNNDGQIQVEEARLVDTLEIRNKKIKELIGIEKFIQLTYLDCSENKIKNIDISKNIFLKRLNISYNKLLKIDVSRSFNLQILKVNNNKLKKIDFRNNFTLHSLWCDSNKLKSLDVSKNHMLGALSISHNKLKSIDVRKNTFLTLFGCASNKLTNLDLRESRRLMLLRCANNPQLHKVCITNKQLKKYSKSWGLEKSDYTSWSVDCYY